ncbi:MAG: FlgD immunoglobulin-like domain containing protein, partial [Candidatus Edwardsbacteria bacterium]|nr:FlgD immunoglobulin-like domain containing protein [Candidatus Edwardsbacteria bacterium]
QLPKAGRVSLKIYNVTGQLVKTLVSGDQPAGSYAVSWDGRDGDNRQLSNGIYFYHLQNGSINITNRMLLIR